jgi:hypothetical protein
MTRPAFVLFKNPRVAPGAPEYCGNILLPDGTAYTIEARVVNNEPPLNGRHFEGDVYDLRIAAQRMARGAKWEGDRAAMPQALLDLVEPPPFDDPIPDLTR